jgi:hypothetical protein
MRGTLDRKLGFAAALDAAGAADGDGFELPEGLLGVVVVAAVVVVVVVGTVVATPGVGRGPAVVGVALEAAWLALVNMSSLINQSFREEKHLRTLAAALTAFFISFIYSDSVSACGVLPECSSAPPMLVPGFIDMPGIPATVSISGSDEAGRA